MKRKIMAVVTAGLLALSVGALGAPAQAATGTITATAPGYAGCNYVAYKATYTGAPGVRAVNAGCHKVAAKVQYVSAGGTKYWATIKKGGVSVESPVPSGTSYSSGKTGGGPWSQGINDAYYVYQTV